MMIQKYLPIFLACVIVQFFALGACGKTPVQGDANNMDISTDENIEAKNTETTKSSEPFTNSMDMTFSYIPPGEFMMGSEKGARNEKPVHKVSISKGFYLQTTEVTQKQWQAVMGTTPWSGRENVKEGPNYPVVYVSWEDAQEFLKKLNAMGDGRYRLPTEAEWEYACRAGSQSKYFFGDDAARLGPYAWYSKNTRAAVENYAHQVALTRPNAFGLYDMHGNVWEWCSDYGEEDYYQHSPEIDPTGPVEGYSRSLRGGSWQVDAAYCRSAIRIKFFSDSRYPYFGFRIAVASKPTK